MSKNDINAQAFKKLFPIFKTKVNGHPLIYFDSVSTAQVPQIVIDKMVEYYTTYKANVGRGLYTFAERATQEFELARANVAQCMNAHQEEIIVTSGATAGINLVAQAWAKQNIKKGDEIIVSSVEHHSNFVPWQQLALQSGAVLKIVPVNERGVVDVEVFKTYLSAKTKLVAMVHTSNILGTTNDIAEIVKASHAVGAKVLVDAAQSVVHQKVDVKHLNCDFLVFSGHKLFGPTGVGILFVKKDLFDQFQLTEFGGGMVYSASFDQTEFKSMPHCFESGTQPIAQLIGLSAAIDFVKEHIAYDALQRYETDLVRLCAQELQEIPGITILSPIPSPSGHSNLVTFVSKDYHAHDIAAHLDQYGIAVRAGHHCVQPYHQMIGVNASVRVSFSVYNSEEEVLFFIECLKKLLK